MSPSERLARFRAWLLAPRILLALAVGLLFLLMAASFVAAPWDLPGCPGDGGGLCDVPITPSSPAGEAGSVTGSLFGEYAILVLVIGLVLASCMIGGVYLAKVEGGRGP